MLLSLGMEGAVDSRYTARAALRGLGVRLAGGGLRGIVVSWSGRGPGGASAGFTQASSGGRSGKRDVMGISA